MFSYVFMKILERRPRSYDRRMDRLSGGQVRRAKERLAGWVQAGAHVLEIGCGTGELAAQLVARGATVHAFDANAAMVDEARRRCERDGLGERLTAQHMAVEAMDDLRQGSYDAVVASLVLSELTDDERRYALRHSHRVLRPGGVIAVADEVWPRRRGRQLAHRLTRAPVALLTYLVSRSTTRPLTDLPGELARAGFVVEREERSPGDAFAVIRARRNQGGTT